MHRGKLTSPVRCSETVISDTDKFIDLMNKGISTNKINKNNIVVFDETIIGGSLSLPVVIGERRDSGGGTIHVEQVRDLMLGCYIPFSMTDGTTPFRVFIFKNENQKKTFCRVTAIAPKAERGFRGQPYRLFFSNQTGYLTLELFAYIMNEFTNWWTTTRPGLDCFLISDNLRAHRNDDVVKCAETNGIHMYNIMAGSSHWFQVHDQLPFALLKKMMIVKKNQFLRSIPATPEARKIKLLCMFYEAEAIAFQPHVLRDSFRSTGLWPFDENIIRKACQEHCSCLPQLTKDDMVNGIMQIIKDIDAEEEAAYQQILSKMKEVEVIPIEEVRKRLSRDESSLVSAEDDTDGNSSLMKRKKRRIAIKPHAKLEQKMKTTHVVCSANGCQRKHYGSKKMVFLFKMQKEFLPIPCPPTA